MNQVLTPAEVLALPEGARVWVEVREAMELSGEHIKAGDLLEDDNGPFTVGGTGHLNHMFRVWSLPQPPTPEELAAWPWPEVGE